MAQQIMAQKRTDVIVSRARRLMHEEQDKATERALSKAYEASKRARALLEELGDI